jgi:low molecular weight protein-tyrosine phosphatase
MISILIVCSGNICRSPALAAALNKLIQDRGLKEKVFVDSCGVTASFLGAPADARMIAAAKKKNIQIEHKAKLFEESYFKVFDLIIAVDHEVLKVLQAMAPDQEKSKIHLISEYNNGQELADPYFDGEGQFDQIMAKSEGIAQAILSKLSL